MDTKLLKKTGFHTGTITIIAVIAGGFFIYKTMLETRLLELEIKQIKADMNMPETLNKQA